MTENKVLVGIHQPNFIPWMGYFNKIKISDVFVILDDVDIVLNSSKAITHRARVKSPQGANWLTLPLQKVDGKVINQQLLLQEDGWKAEMLNNIYHFYRKAQNFDSTYNLVESIISSDEINLSKYNTNGIIKICNHLQIDTPIYIASELNVDYSCKNTRLIELTKAVKGTTYVSGKGGQSYNNEDLFAKENLDIVYPHYQQEVYEQMNGDFIPGLSIIDFLFNTVEIK